MVLCGLVRRLVSIFCVCPAFSFRSMARACVFVACLLCAASALVVNQHQPSGPLSAAEARLAKTCGAQCLAFLHTKSATVGHSNLTAEGALLRAVAEGVEGGIGQSTALVAAHASALRDGFGVGSGVACSTPSACALKTLGANKCNYARIAL